MTEPDRPRTGGALADRRPVPKASSLLAEDLRADIMRSQLQVGDPYLNEQEIIQRSGMARATVREALRLLEAEGLIVTKRGPHGGTRVAQPNAETATRSIAIMLAMSQAPLGDLFALRRVLECEAAALAAVHATEEQVQQLRELSAYEYAPLPNTMTFHDVLARACGNEFFVVTLDIVHALAGWHTPTEPLTADVLHQAELAHQRIAERIAARDPEGAARAMERHMRGFEEEMAKAGRLGEPVIRAQAWGGGPHHR